MQTESSPNTGQTSDDGPTCEPGRNPILSELTLFAAGSPAKTFHTPDSGLALMASDPGCFSRPFAWFANSDRDALCWKTWQHCLLGGWIEFSGRWPRSGMMRNGIAYRLPPLVPRISGTGCSFLPTPTTQEVEHPGSELTDCGKRRKTPNNKSHSLNLADTVKMWPTPTSRDYKDGTAKSCQNVPENGLLGRAIHCRNSPEPQEEISGSLSPTWVEWLMGFPLGWTDCEGLETPLSPRLQNGSDEG